MSFLETCSNCNHNPFQTSFFIGIGGYCFIHQEILMDSKSTTCGQLFRKDLPYQDCKEFIDEHTNEYHEKFVQKIKKTNSVQQELPIPIGDPYPNKHQPTKSNMLSVRLGRNVFVLEKAFILSILNSEFNNTLPGQAKSEIIEASKLRIIISLQDKVEIKLILNYLNFIEKTNSIDMDIYTTSQSEVEGSQVKLKITNKKDIKVEPEELRKDIMLIMLNPLLEYAINDSKEEVSDLSDEIYDSIDSEWKIFSKAIENYIKLYRSML